MREKLWTGMILALLPILAAAQMDLADLQKRASNKDSYALYQLGYLYENGQGVSADAQKAKAYYRQAAALGNSDAKLTLSLINEFENSKISDKTAKYPNTVVLKETNGILSKPNNDISTLIKQAESGDAKAEMQLGLAYDYGYEVVRDMKLATKWYQRAASHGNKLAAQVLEIIQTQK